MILTIRTDKEEAEVSLRSTDTEASAERKWHAHRELSDTLLKVIEELLSEISADWSSLEGIVVYKGPGSFTGLRIGLTVANTLAESLSIPIVGTDTENWLPEGMMLLQSGDNHKIVMPEYGGSANITKPRK